MRNAFLTKAILLISLLGLGAACNDASDELPISAAQPAPEAPAPIIPDPSTQASLRFSPEETPGAPPARSTFAMDQLEDLQLLVTWPNLDGDHQMTVRFVEPNGVVYVEKTVDLSSASDLRIDGQRAAWVSLPIAGTNITARGLVGDWRAEVQLDDATRKTSSAFTLTQP